MQVQVSNRLVRPRSKDGVGSDKDQFVVAMKLCNDSRAKGLALSV
jgi:hypothetical protein